MVFLGLRYLSLFQERKTAKQLELFLFPEGTVLENLWGCKLDLSQLNSWAAFLPQPVYFKPHR